jgi:DNA-binding XRE family transcriptional regulator
MADWVIPKSRLVLEPFTEGLAAMEEHNNVKKIREAKMLSRSELARLAGISPLTLQRIEKGKDCRMATKRKILLALGLSIEQKHTLFKQ